jgi:murein DD-endopeptidase MepM/ murein hydrolase activator NlpD
VDALWSGSVYDCALAKETDGTTRTMLAAYNAGPGNIGAGLGYADHIISKAKDIELELPKADLAGIPKPGPGGCELPLLGYTSTGTFGEGRPGHIHAGEDLAAPMGTPIVPACPGVVSYAGTANGYGNYTCIDHAPGLTTCNGHQSAIYVHVGDRVVLGQIIGRVGSTGHSTGPHDHFEVRNGLWGTPHDPMAWLRSLGLNP